MQKLFDFFSINFKWIVILILALLLFSFFRKCGTKPPNPINSNIAVIEKQIKLETKKEDSLKKVVNSVDSVRIIYKDRWHEAKETIKYLPCDSAIKIVIHVADTLILVDSSLIVNLKRVIVNDSLIITDQRKELIDVYELNRGLSKEARKQKRQKFFAIAGLGALLGYSVLKK